MAQPLLFVGPEGLTPPPVPNFAWHRADPADVRKRCAELRPAAVVSLGHSSVDAEPTAVRGRWLRVDSLAEVTEAAVNGVVFGPPPPAVLVSAFTTTYRSGARLRRPWESLLAQTHGDWEWVVIDDSEGTDTWERLTVIAAADPRVRAFRAALHSGVIGDVKRRAADACRGAWLVELDHDDELVPQAFEWLLRAARLRDDVSFVFSDTVEVVEETGGPFSYGDHAGFGYAGNVNEWHAARGRWMTRQTAATVNRQTLTHLVGMPNHLRAWRADHYRAVGGHDGDLWVADDYDLMLRSFLSSRRGSWVRIAAATYLQYRNAGGDNFTNKRNASIQNAVRRLAERHSDPVDAHAAAVGPLPTSDASPAWASPSPDPRERFEDVFDPNPAEVAVVIATYDRAADLARAVRSVVGQTFRDWRLLVVGDACPSLARTMDELAREFKLLGLSDALSRVRWWNLGARSGKWGAVSRNYALRMLVDPPTRWVAYLDDDNTWTDRHLETMIAAGRGAPPCGLVLSSFLVDGRVVPCDRPAFGRVDTSTIMHRVLSGRVDAYWNAGADVAYANDWDFVQRLLAAGVDWVVTGEATVVYNTASSGATFDSIMALTTDPKARSPPRTLAAWNRLFDRVVVVPRAESDTRGVQGISSKLAARGCAVLPAPTSVGSRTAMHVAAFRAALADGVRTLLVVEEGCRVHGDAARITDELVAARPDWHVLFLSYVPLSSDWSTWTYENLMPTRSGVVAGGALWSSRCYAVGETAMRAADAVADIDSYLARVPLAYGATPQAAVAVSSEGDVQPGSYDARVAAVEDYE